MGGPHVPRWTTVSPGRSSAVAFCFDLCAGQGSGMERAPQPPLGPVLGRKARPVRTLHGIWGLTSVASKSWPH